MVTGAAFRPRRHEGGTAQMNTAHFDYCTPASRARGPESCRLVVVRDESFGAVVVVGAAGEWELGWGNPLGVAVGEFAGGPAVVEEFCGSAGRRR